MGKIDFKDLNKVVVKELAVGILVGISLVFVNFLRLYYFEKVDFLLSVAVCSSLFATVLLAKVIGGILPIIAKRFNIDPAIMAGPLITTIVDAVALIIYFITASNLLNLA